MNSETVASLADLLDLREFYLIRERNELFGIECYVERSGNISSLGFLFFWGVSMAKVAPKQLII